jgi:hypothetical protein
MTETQQIKFSLWQLTPWITKILVSAQFLNFLLISASRNIQFIFKYFIVSFRYAHTILIIQTTYNTFQQSQRKKYDGRTHSGCITLDSLTYVRQVNTASIMDEASNIGLTFHDLYFCDLSIWFVHSKCLVPKANPSMNSIYTSSST